YSLSMRSLLAPPVRWSFPSGKAVTSDRDVPQIPADRLCCIAVCAGTRELPRLYAAYKRQKDQGRIGPDPFDIDSLLFFPILLMPFSGRQGLPNAETGAENGDRRIPALRDAIVRRKYRPYGFPWPRLHCRPLWQR